MTGSNNIYDYKGGQVEVMIDPSWATVTNSGVNEEERGKLMSKLSTTLANHAGFNVDEANQHATIFPLDVGLPLPEFVENTILEAIGAPPAQTSSPTVQKHDSKQTPNLPA